MKKEYTITEGHNALHIRSEGQRYLRIFNAKGQLLLTHHGTDLIELEFLAPPGFFILESDGTVLEALSARAETFSERSIEVLEYRPNTARTALRIVINGMFYNQTPGELIENKLLTLNELKTALVEYFEHQSVVQRTVLIPDHKMIYALMGVYTTREKTQIETTVAKFHTEFVAVEKKIRSAKKTDELLALRPKFPTELLANVIKQPVNPPKQKKS